MTQLLESIDELIDATAAEDFVNAPRSLPRFRWTPAKIELLRRKYKEDPNFERLALVFGIKPKSLVDICRKFGVSEKKWWGWSKEREARFLELYSAGVSHGRIAEELGISRNASIGKAHRMGLPTRKDTNGIGNLRAERLARRRQLHKPRTALVAGKPVRLTKEKKPKHLQFLPGSRDLKPEKSEHAVSFFDLQNHHCRWPVDDGQFCGCKALDRRSYCAKHTDRAYQQVTLTPTAMVEFRAYQMAGLTNGQ